MRVQISSVTYSETITATVKLDPDDGCCTTRLRIGDRFDLCWYERKSYLPGEEPSDPAAVASLLRSLASEIEQSYAALCAQRYPVNGCVSDHADGNSAPCTHVPADDYASVPGVGVTP